MLKIKWDTNQQDLKLNNLAVKVLKKKMISQMSLLCIIVYYYWHILNILVLMDSFYPMQIFCLIWEIGQILFQIARENLILYDFLKLGIVFINVFNNVSDFHNCVKTRHWYVRIWNFSIRLVWFEKNRCFGCIFWEKAGNHSFFFA